MKDSFVSETTDRRRIFILDASKRCEPSAFLFTRAVRFFMANGYPVANEIGRSEIILVNTCCVTEDKVATSIAALDSARAWGKGKTIVLFGCMADLPLQEFDRQGLICIGPKNLGELDSHFPHHTSVDRIGVGRLPPALYEPGQGLGYEDYFLLIAQGCANRCSYCNIKRAKGDVKSEPAGRIIQGLHEGLSHGARDFALLADDCASYGRDIGTDLVQLMEQLFAEAPGFGVKLGYLYPQFILDHFERLGRVLETGRIRYVNIPVQSGSQRILDLMNRRYRIDAVMEAIRQFRGEAGQTVFCTHIMINFPTETHEDFIESLAIADGFDEVVFLHYSDNRGTPAAGFFPKVAGQEVSRRLETASEYANRCKPGRSAVIKDFDCDRPYNIRHRIENPKQ
jgi:threonylcarbamoyladenosine tRNA methylthiotransferase CDKAL1